MGGIPFLQPQVYQTNSNNAKTFGLCDGGATARENDRNMATTDLPKCVSMTNTVSVIAGGTYGTKIIWRTQVIDVAKKALLFKKGFRQTRDQGLYLNRTSRKLFSIDAVVNHDIAWLKARIEEPNPSGDLQIYFNQCPDGETVRYLKSILLL